MYQNVLNFTNGVEYFFLPAIVIVTLVIQFRTKLIMYYYYYYYVSLLLAIES